MKSGLNNIGIAEEMVKFISDKTGIDTIVSRNIIKLVLSYIIEKTFKNGSLTIRGFGRFKTVIRPARNYYNPATGGLIRVPEKKMLKFYLADNLIKKEGK